MTLLTDSGGKPTGTVDNPIYVSGGGGGGGGSTPTGSAGNPNANVVSVQGIANGTTVVVADAAAEAALGAPGDAAWGSGAGTLVALGKAIVGAIKSTLAVTINGALPSGTNALGSVIVSGSAAVGSPPGVPPVPVSGIDTAGNKQHFLTDTGGRQLVINTTSGSLSTNQVSVGTTAGGTLIVAARAGRSSVTIVQEGTTLVRLGASGVTMATGVPLPGTQYAQVTIDGGAAVYGIVASGTQAVSFMECY